MYGSPVETKEGAVMRFRFTVFLLMANIALFVAIWGLEREKPINSDNRTDIVPITMLEIEGKTIDKPRVLKLENNKWRITSPIDWQANLFAVNRILNQIEFLEKETGFAASEAEKRGHGLSEYGLDDPAYTFRYGNGENMYTLKVGKGAAVGNRIYLYDSVSDKILVVDKEFVEGLIVDLERLRNQTVFDIPRFEVAAFSVRLPSPFAPTEANANFRRIGIVRDGGVWKMETPLSALADTKEVDAFLDDVCRVRAVSFPKEITLTEAGFDGATLPAAITLEGTNRRQVLLVGAKTKDATQVYARFEDNPTIFTLDARLFENLEALQSVLRDKAFFHMDASKIKSIEIAKAGESFKLHRLTDGRWDVISLLQNGKQNVYGANLAAVNDIIAKLSNLRARVFVNDAPTDLSRYGISSASRRITVSQLDGKTETLILGSTFDSNGEPLVYAKTGAEQAVYGISRELPNSLAVDALAYRSTLLELLPPKADVERLVIRRISDGKILFEVSALAGGSFLDSLKQMNLSTRKIAAANTIAASVKNFTVSKYLSQKYSNSGVNIDGKNINWEYSIEASAEIPGAAASALEKCGLMFTKRISGTVQYGGSADKNAVFVPKHEIIEALFELTQDTHEPSQLKVEQPVSPKK